MNRPVVSASLIATWLFALTIPLTFAGARIAGVEGVFVGIAIANLALGAIAFITVRRLMRSVERELAGGPG